MQSFCILQKHNLVMHCNFQDMPGSPSDSWVLLTPVADRPMDGPTDGLMDGPTDGHTNGPTDEPTDGPQMQHMSWYFSLNI